MNNPAVMRAIASPYAGAPPNPTATAAPPAPGSPAHAPPNAGTGPAPVDEDPSGLGELAQRANEIKAQSAELAKNLGYLLSDATLHDDVPTKIENALTKAQDALTDIVKTIADAADDIAGIDPDDDDDEESDEEDDDAGSSTKGK